MSNNLFSKSFEEIISHANRFLSSGLGGFGAWIWGKRFSEFSSLEVRGLEVFEVFWFRNDWFCSEGPSGFGFRVFCRFLKM